ncbi:hypothetical protein ACEUZ9_003424 [Paracoccus litorisediminis]|uniref:Uncharacterized protein n=1 Tax=Paracoccus litorisediminis TaxID=2006130 RepID=A0A844HKM0_9RHOB|nr:hypothetical protein [Paracoccus litorisediminis]MTH60763.1 hypothetical protein [Paracoccus litorisediminis]
MAEIPNDLLASLRAALVDLNSSNPEVTDEFLGNADSALSHAFDDLLATSYQIVEVASVSSTLREGAAAAKRDDADQQIETADLALI